MAQHWEITGPKVLDIGDEDERVRELRVAVVGGRVDVLTHDDSPTARVEVTQVDGVPLLVTWDGGRLTVTHGKAGGLNVLEMFKRTVESFSRNRVSVSISVPAGTRTSLSTVSAESLVSGIRSAVKANTVSGTLTLSDLRGELDLNTVSGNVECHDLRGPLAVNAVSGSVTVQASDLPTVRINTVSGDIALDLTTGRSKVTSNSVSGDVTLRAPLTGFDVEGSTASGHVVVDGRTVPGGGRHGLDKGVRIREGDGALTIKAHALSGNIVVLRGHPPAPPGAAGDGPQDERPVSPQDAERDGGRPT